MLTKSPVSTIPPGITERRPSGASLSELDAQATSTPIPATNELKIQPMPAEEILVSSNNPTSTTLQIKETSMAVNKMNEMDIKSMLANAIKEIKKECELIFFNLNYILLNLLFLF